MPIVTQANSKFGEGASVGVSREQAIDIAVAHYAGGRVAVVLSRDELAGVQADVALVMTHATYSCDISRV